MNSLKKGEGVPLLNFEGGPGIPLLNFEGGPGVPILNFEGGPGSGVLVPLLHHACSEKYCSYDEDDNFQLYRAHPDGVIWKNLTIDNKYINKRVWLSAAGLSKYIWPFCYHQALKV